MSILICLNIFVNVVFPVKIWFVQVIINIKKDN